MFFLNPILQHLILYSTNNIVAVEIIEIRHDEHTIFSYNAVLVNKDKTNVSAKKTIINADISVLTDWINNLNIENAAFILNINSDKILHRLINHTDTPPITNYVNEIIPNANPNDFYSQLYQINHNKSFLSIVRKSYIEEIFKNFEKIILSTIQVILGPFSILSSYTLGFKPDRDDTYFINFKNYSFTINNNDLLEYQITPYRIQDDSSEQNFITIGTEIINESLYIAFSSALAFFIQPLNFEGLPLYQIKNNKDEFIFQRTSKPLIITFSSILLLILIISTLVFSIYTTKAEQLKVNQYISQQNWKVINAEKDAYLKQKEILLHNGIVNETNISLYADDITSSLPNEIFIRKMTIYPINPKNTEEDIQFINDKILIEGNCYSSYNLSNWVNTLKNLLWVKTVIIKEFKQNKEDLLGSFIIEITQKTT